MADYIYTMEIRLTPDQTKGVNLVQDIARAAGITLYLTGGAIRDIISGFTIRDLDFTVQGNPLKLQKDFERAGAQLAGQFCHLVAAPPGEVMTSLEFRVATEHPPFAPGFAGRPVVLIESTYCGSIERADRYLRPLKAAEPLLDTLLPRSYPAVQTRKDETLAWGDRFYMKNAFFPAITNEIVDLARFPHLRCSIM